MVNLIGVIKQCTSKKECARVKRTNAIYLPDETDFNHAICTGKTIKGSELEYEMCLTVLDLDVGEKHLDWIECFDILGDYFDTKVVKTGSGGLHFYYWVTDDLIKCTQNKQKDLSDNSIALGLKGVDVRGEGGLIFGVGSKFDEHPDSYTLVNDRPIMKITGKEWNVIYSKFVKEQTKKNPSFSDFELTSKVKPIREGFNDILSGKFEIKHGEQNGVLEFNYWKALWRELFACNADIEKAHTSLRMNQPAYDHEETLRQIGCLTEEEKSKRPSLSFYNKLFPDLKDNTEPPTIDIDQNFENAEIEFIAWIKRWKDSIFSLPKTARPTSTEQRLTVRERVVPLLYIKGYCFILKGRTGDKILGVWARYESGYYNIKEDVTQDLKNEIKYYYGLANISVTRSVISEVMDYFTYFQDDNTKFYIHESNFNSQSKQITFKNGVYDVITKQLTPHTRENYTFSQIPYNYYPDAICPTTEKFIKQLCSDKRGDERELMVKQMWQLIGYSMTLDISIGRGFVLYGPPSTGKSVYNNIITALLGDRDWSKIKMQTLAKEGKKAIAAIANKKLNTFPDLGDDAVKCIGTINDLITEQWLNYEAKYFPDIKVLNTVKHLYMCNRLPIVYDMEEDWGKRWCLWLCSHKIFDKETFDEYVENGKISADLWVEGKGIWNEYAQMYEKKEKHWEFKHIINVQEEMEGIVAHAIKSLHELYAIGDFENFPPQKVIREWMSATSPVAHFLEECCYETDNREEFVKKAYLYTGFMQWVEDHGIVKRVPSSNKQFFMRLSELGYDAGKTSYTHGPYSHKTIRFIKGIGVKRDTSIGEIITWCEENNPPIKKPEYYVENVEVLMEESENKVPFY